MAGALRSSVLSLLILVLLIAVWQIATQGSGPVQAMDPEYARLMGITATHGKSAMPGPLDIVAKLAEHLSHPFYDRGPNDKGIGLQVLYSLGRVGAGYLLAVIVAIPLVDFLRIGEFNMRTAVKDLFLFPPFIALILAFIFQKLRPVEIVYTVIDRFAETLGPLALVSVGLQWQASHLKKFVKELSWGLGFKLLLAPVLIFFIYSAFSYHPDLKKIVVLEAAMGPMITGGIIAMQKNINPPLVAAMLSVGIPLSLLTSLLVRLFFR